MKIILFQVMLSAVLLLNSINILFVDSFDMNTEVIPDEINLFEQSVPDSISNISLKLFSGKITVNNAAVNDSIQVDVMSVLDADWFIPDGYGFSQGFEKILASNIDECCTDEYIYSDGNKKLGIFSIYTPDYPVRNNLGDSIVFKYNLYDIIKSKILDLSAETDYILLCTSIPKKIIKNLISGLPIDFVYSTDYKKYSDEVLNDHTYFMAVKSDKIGFLTILPDSAGTYRYREYDRKR